MNLVLSRPPSPRPREVVAADRAAQVSPDERSKPFRKHRALARLPILEMLRQIERDIDEAVDHRTGMLHIARQGRQTTSKLTFVDDIVLNYDSVELPIAIQAALRQFASEYVAGTWHCGLRLGFVPDDAHDE